MHQVPTADGSEMRPTNLGDARKLGLLPSVSGILDLMSKPGLERWKLQQVAEASLRLTRNGDESDEYFTDRIIEEAFKQVDQAADLGMNIHAEIERFFNHDTKTGPFVPHPTLDVYVSPVINWMIAKGIRVENPESVIINLQHGFAGRMDIPFQYGKGGKGVIDFKSTKTKPGKPVVAYDGQPLQIAAYAAAYWGEQNLNQCFGANVYISTTEPGRVELVRYSPPMLMAEWECFKLLCQLYRHIKKWDPRLDPIQSQPVFHEGVSVNVSQATNLTVPPSLVIPDPQRAKAENVVPVKSVAPIGSVVPFDTKPALDLRVIAACAAKQDVNCDGIAFLTPGVCYDWQMQNSKIKTNYMWFVHLDQKLARVSLKNDPMLTQNGWQGVCFAYPKDSDRMDAAAGKKTTDLASNGLPPKPVDSPTKSTPPPSKMMKTPSGADPLHATKELKTTLKNVPLKGEKITRADLDAMRAEGKKNKIDLAARLVQLESMKITFGKHKDDTIKECDDSYLIWLDEQPHILAKNPEIAEYLNRADVRKALNLGRKEA